MNKILRKTTLIGFAILSGLLTTVVVLLILAGLVMPLRADPGILYVAPDGKDSGNDCTHSANPCATVQQAVDAASPGDEIRVATGTYTDVHGRPVPTDYPSPPASGTITHVVFISKTVTIRGGYTTTDFAGPPDPKTYPTTLDAQAHGRVIYINGNISPTIEGLRITDGDATGLGGGPSGYDAGGGVYILYSDATLNGNIIISNTVGQIGGGLYLESSDATLNGNIVISNASQWGGGLYLRGSDATLISNTVSDNTTSGAITSNGGGLYLWDSDATLISNTVSANTVMAGKSSGSGGGGLFLLQSNAILNSNIVASNTTIVGNGGGLYLVSSNATLNSNIVVSNTATWDWGGGLYLEESDARLNGNNVSANSTRKGGGGLSLESSDAVLINTVVADNQVGIVGSGQYVGSGLYIRRSSPRLLHTTIARNSGGDGSGVHVADSQGIYSTVELTNTILVSHAVGITIATGNTTTINSVLWYGNIVNTGGTGTAVVTDEYIGNPDFANDGYHLAPGSAAINKGVYAGIPTDIDDNPRPLEGEVSVPDLGADEFIGIYLPIIFKNFGP